MSLDSPWHMKFVHFSRPICRFEFDLFTHRNNFLHSLLLRMHEVEEQQYLLDFVHYDLVLFHQSFFNKIFENSSHIQSRIEFVSYSSFRKQIVQLENYSPNSIFQKIGFQNLRKSEEFLFPFSYVRTFYQDTWILDPNEFDVLSYVIRLSNLERNTFSCSCRIGITGQEKDESRECLPCSYFERLFFFCLDKNCYHNICNTNHLELRHSNDETICFFCVLGLKHQSNECNNELPRVDSSCCFNCKSRLHPIVDATNFCSFEHQPMLV